MERGRQPLNQAVRKVLKAYLDDAHLRHPCEALPSLNSRRGKNSEG
jgi:hypothetical protein